MLYTALYKKQILALVIIGTLMAAMDSSIVNISVPTIMADFGTSLENISWIVTSYMLAFAVFMPLSVWLRDRIGHKILYLSSIGIFTLGSLLCGLAWNLPTLIIARVIQAAGGGALTPSGMAILSEVFEPEERPNAIGYWGMGAVMGPALGPTIGGALTKLFGWPSIFLINIPIGIAAVIFGYRVMKSDRPHPSSWANTPFDAAGFVLLAISLVSFLLCMSKSASHGWNSAFVISSALIFLISFSLFLFFESRVEYKIMDLGLLKNPVFASCLALTSFRSLALYGGSFLLPIFMQNYMKLDEVQCGLILLPGSLLMAFLMPVSGRLSMSVSVRTLSQVGFIFLSLFFFGYAHLTLVVSSLALILPTFLRAIGVALSSAPLTATALNSIPKNKAGMASSMLNIIQQVGGSIGISLLSIVLHSRSMSYLQLGKSNLNADIFSFQDTFIFGGILTLLGLIITLKLPSQAISKKKLEGVVLE